MGTRRRHSSRVFLLLVLLVLTAFAKPAATAEAPLRLMADPALKPVTAALKEAHRRPGAPEIEISYQEVGEGASAAFADVALWLGGAEAGASGFDGAFAGVPMPVAAQLMAVWSTRRDVRHMRAADLLAPAFQRIAVVDAAQGAGRAARLVLQQAGVWGPLHGRLRFAASAKEAVQMVLSGAVDAGVLPFSAMAATGAGQGNHVLLPARPGTLPVLWLALTHKGAARPEALGLAAFITSAQAEAVLRRFGYARP